MNCGPLMFQCACLHWHCRSIASASRRLKSRATCVRVIARRLLRVAYGMEASSTVMVMSCLARTLSGLACGRRIQRLRDSRRRVTLTVVTECLSARFDGGLHVRSEPARGLANGVASLLEGAAGVPTQS